MTQAEIINLLNSKMPELSKTTDREGTLLKCAREHNLAAAQLEKLGCCFNTMRTLIQTDYGENRGDSFPLLDVPAMVGKYMSYDPAQELSIKSAGVLVDDVPLEKAASSSDRIVRAEGRLPKRIAAEFEAAMMDMREKEAAVITDPTKEYYRLQDACKQAQSGLDEAKYLLAGSLYKIASTYDLNKWNEIVEDIVTFYPEKGKSLIDTCENYFFDNKIPFTPYDFTKIAADTKSKILYDRYGITRDMGSLQYFQDTCTELETALQDLTSLRKAAGSLIDDLNSVAEERAQRDATAPTSEEEAIVQALRDEAARRSQEKSKSGGPGSVLPTASEDEREGATSDNQEANADIPPTKTHPKLSELFNADPSKSPDKGNKGDNGDKDGYLSTSTPGDIASDVITNSADSLVQGLNNPLFTSPGVMTGVNNTFTMLDRLKPNDDRRTNIIDADMATARQDATFQALRLSDPILKDADPERLRDVFMTVSKLSPALAADQVLIGHVLREAAQQDYMLPLNTIQMITGLQSTIDKNK